MERRALSRSSTGIPITCCRFSIHGGAVTHEGIMLNYSSGGSYIELDQYIDEGAIVMLKSNGAFHDGSRAVLPDGFRSVSLAEVRWAMVIDGDMACRFGFGLKYFNL